MIFFTIKSLWVGDLELKYKIIIFIFRRDRHHLISCTHAEHTHKFIMCICPAYASVPYAFAQHVLKRPFQFFNF
jgi:hypothetical protein